MHARRTTVTGLSKQRFGNTAAYTKCEMSGMSDMRTAARATVAGLQAAHVPFVRPVAGMFVWVDMRGALKEPTPEGERALWQVRARKSARGCVRARARARVRAVSQCVMV